MAAKQKALDQLIEEVEQIRDELEVQMHLASADARDRWDELEKKLSHLRSRARTVGRAAGEAAGNVGEALDLLAHELKRGYEKIRSLL